MTAIDDVYYADVTFLERGSHFIRVFENGVLVCKEILTVGNDSLIIYP